MNEINTILEQEIKLNKKEAWNKLDKTRKLKSLNDYAAMYCRNHNLTEPLTLKNLRDFLKLKLNQRRFNSNKDLVYDIEKGVITNIPTLVYDNETFILNRNDNRHSTIRCLTPTIKKN